MQTHNSLTECSKAEYLTKKIIKIRNENQLPVNQHRITNNQKDIESKLL